MTKFKPGKSSLNSMGHVVLRESCYRADARRLDGVLTMLGVRTFERFLLALRGFSPHAVYESALVD